MLRLKMAAVAPVVGACVLSVYLSVGGDAHLVGSASAAFAIFAVSVIAWKTSGVIYLGSERIDD